MLHFSILMTKDLISDLQDIELCKDFLLNRRLSWEGKPSSF